MFDKWRAKRQSPSVRLVEDVSAALATITVQGTPTKVATTQLRQALVELSKEGSKTDLIFRDLSGVSFRDFISSGGDRRNGV